MNSLTIVGAGITGLTIAEYLKSQFVDLVVLEKSKSVGGRLATRRDGLATYDHGAQFYKHSEAHPFPWHQRWQARHVTQNWFSEEKFQGFSGRQGMTGLAKDLAFEKKIHFNQKIVQIHQNGDLIRAETESGQFFDSKYIVLTSPLPQSLEILKNSKMTFPEALSEISYAKALVGLFEIEEVRPSLFVEAFKKPVSSSIYSIANNQMKRISQSLCLSVVMNEEFSETNFMENDLAVLVLIKSELHKIYGKEFKVLKGQLKKWRYSHPKSCFPRPYLLADSNPHVILAGDAFGGPSLYGAVKSGQAVAQLSF